MIFILGLIWGSYGNATRRKLKVFNEVKSLVEEALVEAPVDREVCFSPDERCDLKLVRFVETAKSTLDIAVFDLNLDQLVHSILLNAKRGVRVRVLVDRRQSKGAYSLVSTLVKGGVDVRLGAQRGLMHHKFTVLDRKRLETGSFNYTAHASRANQENQIYLDDPAIVSRFMARFEKSWANSRKWKD